MSKLRLIERSEVNKDVGVPCVRFSFNDYVLFIPIKKPTDISWFPSEPEDPSPYLEIASKYEKINWNDIEFQESDDRAAWKVKTSREELAMRGIEDMDEANKLAADIVDDLAQIHFRGLVLLDAWNLVLKSQNHGTLGIESRTGYRLVADQSDIDVVEALQEIDMTDMPDEIRSSFNKVLDYFGVESEC